MLNKPRKYKRCSECRLDIRCGDAERHEAGFHHRRRLETLTAAAKLAARKSTL